MEDSLSTVEVVQYSGGIASVLWRLFSTVGDNISTCGGFHQYMWGDNISTVEGIQYCGGTPSVLWGDNSSTCGGLASVLWGIPSVLWRLFNTVGITSVQWRVFSTLGDNISTCGG